MIDKIHPAVAVIIAHKGKILLHKRSDSNIWCLPTGHMEIGETVEMAAIREIKEETGLDIKIVRLIGVYSEPEYQVVAYPDGRVTHFVTMYLEGEIVGEKLDKNNSETLDLGFFPINQMPEDRAYLNPYWIDDFLSKSEETFLR